MICSAAAKPRYYAWANADRFPPTVPHCKQSSAECRYPGSGCTDYLYDQAVHIDDPSTRPVSYLPNHLIVNLFQSKKLDRKWAKPPGPGRDPLNHLRTDSTLPVGVSMITIMKARLIRLTASQTPFLYFMAILLPPVAV